MLMKITLYKCRAFEALFLINHHKEQAHLNIPLQGSSSQLTCKSDKSIQKVNKGNKHKLRELHELHNEKGVRTQGKRFFLLSMHFPP